FILHRVNKPRTLDEIGRSANDRVVKLWQLFRIDTQIAVQNHEEIARGGFEPVPDSIAFAAIFLSNQFDIPIPILGDCAFNFRASSIAGVALNENNFGATTKLGNTIDSRLNIAALVATRHDDGTGERFPFCNSRPRNTHAHEAEMFEQWKIYQKPITKSRKSGNVN